MGRRLTDEQLLEKKALQKLIRNIRKSANYLSWKKRILERDVVSYPVVPANIQVHHLKDITRLLEKYNITNYHEAMCSEELWKAKGITLTRGEHFLLTKLNRYKFVTQGFMDELQDMMYNKFIIVPIDINSTVKKWKKPKIK